MIHCISAQPDVIRRQLPGDDVVFHSYENPRPAVPAGSILILHEPTELWLHNHEELPHPSHRILLAENPRACDIKIAVNRLGIIRIIELARLSKIIKEVFQEAALLSAQDRMEVSAP